MRKFRPSLSAILKGTSLLYVCVMKYWLCFVAHTSLSHVDGKHYSERGLFIGRENLFWLFGLNIKCIVLLNALTLIEAICPKIHCPRMKKSSFGRTSSLRSRRLEVMGERENGRARATTSKRLLRRLSHVRLCFNSQTTQNSIVK